MILSSLNKNKIKRSWKNKRFDVATNFLNNNQHVKVSLITLKVSAVWTVQQYPNVIKFHGAKLGLSYTKVVHEKKDKNDLQMPTFQTTVEFA